MTGDLNIDGVPLPSDASVASATALQRRWCGVWVGAWNGGLKHILVVERIADDGVASVVFAEADNPHTREKARWRRLDAVVSERTLTVAERVALTATMTVPVYTATYEIDENGQVDAVFKSGGRIARAAMNRMRLASLKRATVVPWSRGTSELLQTDLRDEGDPVRLETVIFRPSGSGPFPLAVFHHGTAGKSPTPDLLKQTWVSLEIADFLNRRGWLVAFPQRRGRGKSDGFCEEEVSRTRKSGLACNLDVSIGAAVRALTDIDAAIALLRRRPDVAPGPILIGGHSHGGLLSIAFAGAHPEQTKGVLNFVGGWSGEGCAKSELINQTLFARGASYGRPTIWLYGEGDQFYSLDHSRKNFAAFENAGGQGKFVAFDVPRDVGHNVIHYPDLWASPVSEYLDSLTGGHRT
jgi:dienelactone hydrolase